MNSGRYLLDPVPRRVPTQDARPLTLEIDGRIVLVPTTLPDGTVLSDAEALKRFMQTGQSLGAYGSIAEANRAAGALQGLLAPTARPTIEVQA